MNAKNILDLPIQLNWIADIDAQLFHLQYLLNNESLVPISPNVTHLAFELWFQDNNPSLPGSFVKSSPYLIEQISQRAYKITLKPGI